MAEEFKSMNVKKTKIDKVDPDNLFEFELLAGLGNIKKGQDDKAEGNIDMQNLIPGTANSLITINDMTPEFSIGNPAASNCEISDNQNGSQGSIAPEDSIVSKENMKNGGKSWDMPVQVVINAGDLSDEPVQNLLNVVDLKNPMAKNENDLQFTDKVSTPESASDYDLQTNTKPLEVVQNDKQPFMEDKQKENDPKAYSSDSNNTVTADVPSSKIKTNEYKAAEGSAHSFDKAAAEKNLNVVANKIVHKVKTISDGDSTTIKIKLYPEKLGEMEITLSMEHGKLTGKILVENKDVGQAFSDRLSDLNQTLRDNNINVSKFEVGIGTGQNQSQERQQGNQQMNYRNNFIKYMWQMGQDEEWNIGENASVRGIDLLA